MGLFTRRSQPEIPPNDEPASEDLVAAAHGPHDIGLRGQVGEMVDFGSLFIPYIPGLHIAPELGEDQESVVGITLLREQAMVRLSLMAAPKSGGLWEEMRAEISAELQAGGNEWTDLEGVWGKEIGAEVASPDPKGKRQLLAMRFAGVEGPNWLLRVIFTGPGASDQTVAKPIMEVLDQCFVSRDPAPLPPRSLLPLRMPTQFADQA